MILFQDFVPSTGHNLRFPPPSSQNPFSHIVLSKAESITCWAYDECSQGTIYIFYLSLITFVEVNPLTSLLLEDNNILEGRDHALFIFTTPTPLGIQLVFNEYLKEHLSSHKPGDEKHSSIWEDSICAEIGLGSTENVYRTNHYWPYLIHPKETVGHRLEWSQPPILAQVLLQVTQWVTLRKLSGTHSSSLRRDDWIRWCLR